MIAQSGKVFILHIGETGWKDFRRATRAWLTSGWMFKRHLSPSLLRPRCSWLDAGLECVKNTRSLQGGQRLTVLPEGPLWSNQK